MFYCAYSASKTQSGRNYLEVGQLTETMFPMHNIRFIAVNDGVDSAQGEDDFTPFRNIINDFLSHLIEIKGKKDVFELIVRFFQAMKVSPEMHPLVYSNECEYNQKPISKKLFADGVIKISDFAQITSNPDKKRYYEMQVQMVYKQFMGKEYPCDDVCIDWAKGQSLGEVHTTVFCVMIGCDCFLSDDKDVARHLGNIIHKIMCKPISVKNRKDCCDQLKKLPQGSHDLNRDELRALSHKYA